MSEPTPLAKAELRQLDSEFKRCIEPETWVKVQFNPETLKVTFANQLKPPPAPGDLRGASPWQLVGAGTTKLALQLWFDVTGQPEGMGGAVDDVRKLTQKVAFFFTPKPNGAEGQPPAEGEPFIVPPVRFMWGSFQFDGIMESLEESLEFFSHEGRPLRASVSFTLTQQKITAFSFREAANEPAGAGTSPSGRPVGTAPMTPATAGATIQGLAASRGKGGDWQSIAAANGIENPRRLEPGRLIDLQAGLNIRVKR